jgi:hypothetical protein
VQQCPRTLGYSDLASYLTDRYLHKEHSLPAIADELGVTIHVVRGLRDAFGIGSHGGVRARGRARQAASDQRATARAAELGFTDLRAYLTDRYTQRAWTIPQVAAESRVGERVVKRLLGSMEVRRVQATALVAAAAERGRAREAELVRVRRQARLAALGFADLGLCLADRYVRRGGRYGRCGPSCG